MKIPANLIPRDDAVVGSLRWAMVIIFALFGTAKFAAYEAEGVAGIAQHYPLFAWMYPLWGVQGASNVIGTIELATGLLIALGSRIPLASLVGGLMGMFTFLVTLSFSLGAPGVWEKGYGFPFMGSTGQFLFKDVVLLAACFAIAVAGAKRLAKR